MESYPVSARTRVNRRPQRGHYDRATVHAILDEAFICHVGFVSDGRPVVIPTAYGRDGETLYLHGAPASRMLKALGEGVDVCVTVTLTDGIVLARSVFHHSLNYRSVVIFGRARVVAESAGKLRALRCFSDHLVAGRWDDARQPTQAELDGTLVLALPLEEVSAKVRSGPPIDDPEDMESPVWAGVLPLAVTASACDPDPQMRAGIAEPGYLRQYSRRRPAPTTPR